MSPGFKAHLILIQVEMLSVVMEKIRILRSLTEATQDHVEISTDLQL